jgi:hypothetical protein
MFRLTTEEWDFLRSQFVTLKEEINYPKNQTKNTDNKRGKHRKYFPYVFTEQGVAMLSAVLRSPVAVDVSIQIMKAFVEMRRFLKENGEVFMRLDRIEDKQTKFELQANEKFEQVFNALQIHEKEPKQGIFFNGQIFDAYRFVSNLIRNAKESIILIDNYVDDTTLSLFVKRNKEVLVTIYTKNINKQLALDLKKYNEQYDPVRIEEVRDEHDRFLIIDNQTVYHIGASLKDLGKKWFAFSKMDAAALDIILRLKNGCD